MQRPSGELAKAATSSDVSDHADVTDPVTTPSKGHDGTVAYYINCVPLLAMTQQ